MPYKTQSEDTHRVIEERQIAHFRRMGMNNRLSYGAQLMDDTHEILWARLARAHPAWTPEQLKLEWIRLYYGEEFAERYNKYRQCNLNQNSSNAR